jgi:IgA Peptidase M64
MKKHLSFFAFLLLASGAFGAVRIQQNNGQNYTAILNNGSTTQKYDIVFVGDGFTANDQTAFNNAVAAAVDALRARPGYSETMCAFNIWRVNVVSTDSGIDHPMQSITRNTELDCRYGNTANNEAERCITSDSPAKCFEAAAYAPDADATFVLVNDMQWGGCAGAVVFSSISSGFDGIITHELGHKVGSLADEYDCYICDGSDDGRTYSGDERPAANVTTNTDRATTKWSDLINAATPLPTTADNPPGVVGLFAGGDYFAQGIFRPQFTCHMRTTGSALCAVCQRRLKKVERFKCSACEIDPHSIFCLFGDILKNLHLRYRQPFRIRWPYPVCLSCPLPGENPLEEIANLKLNGVLPDFKVQVLDDQENVVAEGAARGEGVDVSFTASRARSYFVELTSGPEANGAALNIGAELTRNGQIQQLPAIRN